MIVINVLSTYRHPVVIVNHLWVTETESILQS
jgi:hypothetical protein